MRCELFIDSDQKEYYNTAFEFRDLLEQDKEKVSQTISFNGSWRRHN